MSLQNLSKIGQLETHTTDAKQLNKLLESAARNLADAKEKTISNETRLDAAYRAITQMCMAALWANGYRTSKRKPGHHQTMIQSLVHSVGLDSNQVMLLETFRIKRNAIDYTAEDVDGPSVAACIRAAEDLRRHFVRWLRSNRPELLN
ncbi:MAG: hypothetical protein WBM54_15490 [Woeseia sp.]